MGQGGKNVGDVSIFFLGAGRRSVCFSFCGCRGDLPPTGVTGQDTHTPFTGPGLLRQSHAHTHSSSTPKPEAEKGIKEGRQILSQKKDSMRQRVGDTHTQRISGRIRRMLTKIETKIHERWKHDSFRTKIETILVVVRGQRVTHIYRREVNKRQLRASHCLKAS